MQDKNANVHFEVYENRRMQHGMKTLCSRIEERRKLLKLTQADLARRSGIDQSQISRLVNGKIKNPPYLYELAKALETNIKWLKYGIGDENITEGSQEIEQEIPRVSGENSRSPYQKAVNSMTSTEEAAEIFTKFLISAPDTQKRVAEWITKHMVSPAMGSSKIDPKKNN